MVVLMFLILLIMSGLLLFILSVSMIFGWLLNCLCSSVLVFELLVKNSLLICWWFVSVMLVFFLFCMRFSMLDGNLVVCYILIVVCVMFGVSLDGLNMIVLLVISVGMIWLFGKWLGKLYGLNIVMMLCGWWCSIVMLLVMFWCFLLVCFWYVWIEMLIFVVIDVILVCVFYSGLFVLWLIVVVIVFLCLVSNVVKCLMIL